MQLKNALSNKALYNNWIKDQQDNRFIKNVTVEVPMTKKDGTPIKDNNGVQKTQTQTMSMDDQWRLYKQGKITRLNYSGAEDAVKINPLDFSKVVKDPNDPFNAKPVTTEDIITYAMTKGGASREHAEYIAGQYAVNAQKSGQPWYWGVEDKYAAAEKMARTQGYLSKARGGKAGKDTAVRSIMGAKIRRVAPGGRDVVGPKEREWWNEQKRN